MSSYFSCLWGLSALFATLAQEESLLISHTLTQSRSLLLTGFLLPPLPGTVKSGEAFSVACQFQRDKHRHWWDSMETQSTSHYARTRKTSISRQQLQWWMLRPMENARTFHWAKCLVRKEWESFLSRGRKIQVLNRIQGESYDEEPTILQHQCLFSQLHICAKHLSFECSTSCFYEENPNRQKRHAPWIKTTDVWRGNGASGAKNQRGGRSNLCFYLTISCIEAWNGLWCIFGWCGG